MIDRTFSLLCISTLTSAPAEPQSQTLVRSSGARVKPILSSSSGRMSQWLILSPRG